MRLFRVVAAGAATAAILGLTSAGVAVAQAPDADSPVVDSPLVEGGGSAEVLPDTVRPGQTVQIYTKACAGRAAKAESLAFVATARLTPGANSLTGSAQIKPDIGPGPYAVNISCEGGGTAEAAVEVVRGEPSPSKCPSPVTPAEPSCGGHHPSGPVHAGGGAQAAQSFEPGGRTGVFGMVGAGVLAVAGIALITVRRRRTEP